MNCDRQLADVIIIIIIVFLVEISRWIAPFYRFYLKYRHLTIIGNRVMRSAF